MTALIGVRVHPSVCPCEALGVIGVSAVGRAREDQTRVEVSRMVSVISCPHCRDRSDLDRYLGCAEGAALPDGGVA